MFSLRLACGIFAALAIFSLANANEEGPSPALELQSKIRGAFFGALMADALCLGSHYEYDAVKIHQAYNGTLAKYVAPGEHMGGQTHGVGWGQRNYHPGTVAGDQTDYGQYNILVLEHYALMQHSTNLNQPFSVESFLPLWKKRLTSSNWKQWKCTQTKRALQLYDKGYPAHQLGGPSNAMALRYAAAFAAYDKEKDLVQAARGSMFTHSEATALMGNGFFARLVFRVLRMKDGQSQSLRSVIEQVASESDEWIQNKVAQAIAKFEEATNPETDLSKEPFVDDLALTSMARLWDVGKSEPIKVGKASPTEGTLPGALYFILKYEHSLEAAAKANAMVGGDNASRSIPVGMVLGAHHGVEAIPETLKETLNAWKTCEDMLDTLPLLVNGQQREEL